MQGTGGFKDYEVDNEDFGVAVLGLCFNPLWILTPFFEVDSKSKSHMNFTS